MLGLSVATTVLRLSFVEPLLTYIIGITWIYRIQEALKNISLVMKNI